jgi:outer membrane lipoprotein-sorting protein
VNTAKATATLLLFSLAANVLYGESANTNQAKPRVDAKAEQVVRKMADYYRDLKSFEGKHRTQFSNSSGSYDAGLARFAAQRPNLLAIVPEATNEPSLTCDGTNLFEYQPYEYRIYYVNKAPAELEGVTNGKPGIMLHTIFRADRYDYVMSGFNIDAESPTELVSLRYLGTEQAEGIPCDHLRMVEKGKAGVPDAPSGTTNDLWIASGDSPAAVRFEFRINGPSINVKTGAEITNDVVVLAETISDWKANKVIPPERFKFVPPPGSVRVNPEDKKIVVKQPDGSVIIIDRASGSVEFGGIEPEKSTSATTNDAGLPGKAGQKIQASPDP